jgi:tape measure domain-containing protein
MASQVEIVVKTMGMSQVASSVRSVNESVKGMKDGFTQAGAGIKASLETADLETKKLGEDVKATGIKASAAGEQVGVAGAKIKGAGTNISNAGKAAKTAGKDMEEAGKSTSNYGKALDLTADKIGSMASAAETGAKLVGMAMVAATGAAIGFGIKSAAAMQTSMVSFTLMLGSAQKAKTFLAQLQQFAVVTPFELADLQTYASRLLAVGVNASSIIPLLTRIGDATAAVGTGSFGIERAVNALNDMKLANDVNIVHLRELAFAGVPIFDALAAHFHTTTAKIKEMVSDSKVSVADVFQSIQDGAGPAFAKINGMMTKQSATLAGQWSNLKDSLSQTLGKLFQPWLAPLSQLVNWVGQKIPIAISSLKVKWHEFQDFIEKSNIVADIKKIAKEFKFGQDINDIKMQAEDFVKTVKKHWPEIKQAAEAVGIAILIIIKALLVLTQGTIKLWGVSVVIWSKMVDAVNAVLGAIRNVLNAIARVFEVAAKIPGPWQAAFKAAAKAARDGANEIQKAIGGIKTQVNVDVDYHVHGVTGSLHHDYASGGAVSGAAAGGVRSGLSWVGERGAELLKLPAGSMVYPHGQSERMAAAAGAGGGPIEITIRFAGNTDTAFAQAFNKLAKTGAIQIRQTSIVG